MPFIKVKVSTEITKEQECDMKRRMGKAIELVPGKTEDYLLLEFEENCRLWLRGSNEEPIAYIEAAIFGNEPHYGYQEYAKEMTRIVSETLKIPAENIYIKYEDITGWTFNGMYIDRRQF